MTLGRSGRPRTAPLPSAGCAACSALVAAVILVDTMFYAAIVPLLPEYADELGLSKTRRRGPQRLLRGRHPARGAALGVPRGADRGSRRRCSLGLALLGVSSLAFAFADDVVVLDLARFAQGVGGACAWTGGLAWLLAAAPATSAAAS